MSECVREVQAACVSCEVCREKVVRFACGGDVPCTALDRRHLCESKDNYNFDISITY